MKDYIRRLLNADARLSKRLSVPEEQRAFSLLLKVIAHSGDSWFWLAGLFLVWLFSEGEWRDRAAFLAIGLFVMAGAVVILKYTIRRPRPEGEWGQIYRLTDPHSFPSGHAARSAALMVMGLVVGPPWFAIALVIWAPWVGLSRVALGVHYLSDVVVGWLVGALMGGIALLLRPQIIQLVDYLLEVVTKALAGS
jgi:undecaprenyl-diphosphatase